jgi:CheY-like chemotaxis protein
MIRPEIGLSELGILIVDDEDVNLLLLRRTLENAGYTRVQATTDPTQVPGLFVEIEPALVVLDLHMPRMDGFELMDRLAALAGGRSGVPFLVLTAACSSSRVRSATCCSRLAF